MILLVQQLARTAMLCMFTLEQRFEVLFNYFSIIE